MPRTRRAILAAIGGLSVGGLGWRSVLGKPGTLGVPTGESSCPGHSWGGSPGSEAGSPADGPARVVCTSVGEDPLHMALVGSERTNGPAAADFRFDLTNTVPRRYDTNPFHWVVWKRHEGVWFSLYPRRMEMPALTLWPGEAMQWRLVVRTGEPVVGETAFARGDSTGARLAALGGGEYAVSNLGTFGGVGRSAEATAVRFATRFSLETPPVELVRSSPKGPNQYGPRWVTDWFRDGATVTVRVDPPWGGGEDRLLVERTDDSPDRWLLPEHVVRRWWLRDALAFFEADIDRVRLRAPSERVSPFFSPGSFVLRFEGETYRLSSPGSGGDT